MTEENTMKSAIVHAYEQLDYHTYGLAEMLLVGGIGSLLAIGWYCVLATITYGYVQLFSLFTGAI